MKRSTLWLGLLAVLSASPAQAFNQEIRALFRPDSSQPNKNVFVNQTPNSGYCATNPAECANLGMFSIELPVRFDATRAIEPGDGIGMKVPANWRQLTVVNRETGHTETVEVRIIGIGSTYRLNQSAASLVGVTDPLEGHRQLWTGNSWVYAPPPCVYSGVGYYLPESYGFFWKAPVESPCTKVAAYRIPTMYFDKLDFAYELRTPNPLGMSSGQYHGSLTYTLGPAGDFQMGSMMVADDGSLTLDFVLDVQHTLKAELPPGGNMVVMEPAGGWQRWLETGQAPTSIYREQIFYLSASSRFKVMLVCRWSTGGPCEFGNGTGGSAKFEVYFNAPEGVVGPGGSGRPVGLDHNTWRGPFEPSRYIDRKPGILRFSIVSGLSGIPALLRYGGTFKGSVTIILDSEV